MLFNVPFVYLYNQHGIADDITHAEFSNYQVWLQTGRALRLNKIGDTFRLADIIQVNVFCLLSIT